MHIFMQISRLQIVYEARNYGYPVETQIPKERCAFGTSGKKYLNISPPSCCLLCHSYQQDAAKVCRQFVEREKDEVRFSAVALCKA